MDIHALGTAVEWTDSRDIVTLPFTVHVTIHLFLM